MAASPRARSILDVAGGWLFWGMKTCSRRTG